MGVTWGHPRKGYPSMAEAAMGTRAAEALPLALTATLATAKRKRRTGRKNRLAAAAAAAAVGLVKGGYQLTGSP